MLHSSDGKDLAQAVGEGLLHSLVGHASEREAIEVVSL
jgi:hypothetical protein